MVDENSFESTASNIGGKAEDAAGGMAGDAGTRVRSQGEQMTGTAQDAFVSAKDAVSDWIKVVVEFTENKPIAALLIAVSAGFVLRMYTRTSRR